MTKSKSHAKVDPAIMAERISKFDEMRAAGVKNSAIQKKLKLTTSQFNYLAYNRKKSPIAVAATPLTATEMLPTVAGTPAAPTKSLFTIPTAGFRSVTVHFDAATKEIKTELTAL